MNWLLGLLGWVDKRIPIISTWEKHLSKYYAPKNFNAWYFFGSLAMLVLVNQLLTGVWLTMFYEPTEEGAFASVEYIMRDVQLGWVIRYMHSTGASAFFAVVYLHMLRGMMYGSYQKPRELLWLIGMVIYVVLMAEAFMGYVLPWGQMSLWGAKVIISLFGTIPIIGGDLQTWIQGDFVIAGATLTRFFSLHVIAMPLVLIMLVFVHIVALHEVGSNNPDGIEIKKNKDENGIPKDGIPFHPYYSVHDIVGICYFLFIFIAIIFFAPEMGGYFLEAPNFEHANFLKTPDHIAPVWYFTPFYSMLRAVPDPFWGFVVMGAGIVVLFFLPWLDRSGVKSIRYKGMISKVALIAFIVSFLILGVLGTWAPSEGRALLAVTATIVYFMYFLAMPFWTSFEKTKPVPERVVMKGIGTVKFLGLVVLILVLTALPLKAVAAGGAVHLDHMQVNLDDKASLQSGAQIFTNYCMGCHSTKYARYQRVADDLGIPRDLYEEHLVFDGSKIGSLMEIAMTEENAKAWFGVAPPDLTLVARVRSPDWLYTYMRSFYRDDTRPFGVNNKTFPNVGMPHMLVDLQGLQECGPGAGAGKTLDTLSGDVMLDDPCGSLEVKTKGSMSTEEYDKAVFDLVNFLAYMGEPIQDDRKRIGIYALLLLLLFSVFAYLLNREYWKGIH
jgi:ubiquinol-cytochrome c reductase cytochrome b subunit